MRNSTKSDLEIEVRGLLTKDEYSKIFAFLDNAAEYKETDNKISYFFIIQKGVLKVSDEKSKNKAKISYKYGDESKNILEEFEIPIARKDVLKTIEIFKSLGFVNMHKVQQKRINFAYRSATVSIKETPDFGPHFEIEMPAKNRREAKFVHKNLIKICQDLGLKPLSRQKMKDLIASINIKHGFAKNV